MLSQQTKDERSRNIVTARADPETMQSGDPWDIANDRLSGAKRIAEYLGLTERQARVRLDKGLIPHTREGSLHVASKRALDEDWRRRTAGGER